MTMRDNRCEVCNRDNGPVQVACSAVGPASFAYCSECAHRNAEPLPCFSYLYDDVGNEGEGLADYVKTLQTYANGGYLTWDEYVAKRKDGKLTPLRDRFKDTESCVDPAPTS